MKQSINQAGNVAVWAVVAVAALVIGFAGGKAMSNNSSSKTNSASQSAAPTASTKAADLRSNLVRLGVQHQELTAKAVGSALGGSADAAAYGKALYANGNDIGAAVGSVYGKQAEATFDSVWKVHLDEFVNYAVAGSKGDKAAQKTALDNIQNNYTKPLAQYLAKANPNIDEATLESALKDHVQMTADMIDLHIAGKYTEEAAQLKSADQHIEGIFSSLANAIVKQYPDKFRG